MPNVVVLSSDHDAVTRTLHTYALDYIAGTPVNTAQHLHNAESNQIHEAVADPDVRGVFVFLHGSKTPIGFLSHAGALILGHAIARTFRNRIVCGTCYSLNAFGTMVTRNQGTVIGYKGQLMVPTKTNRAREMTSAMLSVHRTLQANRSATEAFNTAVMEYRTVADRWGAEGTIEGQVLAAFANMNSSRVGVKGNFSATL